MQSVGPTPGLSDPHTDQGSSGMRCRPRATHTSSRRPSRVTAGGRQLSSCKTWSIPSPRALTRALPERAGQTVTEEPEILQALRATSVRGDTTGRAWMRHCAPVKLNSTASGRRDGLRWGTGGCSSPNTARRSSPCERTQRTRHVKPTRPQRVHVLREVASC